MIFERDERVKHLYLKAGALIGSRSNLVPEGIDMVLKRGFLPSSDLLAVTEFDKKRSRDEDWDAGIIERLEKEKVLPREEVLRALSFQLRERVTTLLGWFEGRYAVQTAETPPSNLPTPPPLPLPLFFEELEKFLLVGEVPEKSALSDETLPLQGTLRSMGGASIFISLARQGATGKLLFERGQRRKLFDLEKGVVTQAASSDPGETLGSVLHRWGYLRDDIVTRLESTARKGRSRFRDLLRREKLLTEEEITSCTLVLHSERILEAFSWRSGSYHFRGTLLKAEEESPSLPPEVPQVKEERTERYQLVIPDHLRGTAETLSNLFRPSPHNALLFVETPYRGVMEREAKHLGALWHGRDGEKSLLVSIASPGSVGINPIAPSVLDEYRKSISSTDVPGVEVLSISPEEQEWRSAEGIAAFASLTQELARGYRRVLYIVSPPPPGSPLWTTAGPALFVLFKGETEKSQLMSLIQQAGQTGSMGFLFHDAEKEGTWHALKDHFTAVRDRWISSA